MATLSELLSQSQHIEKLIIENQGELTPEVERALALVDLALPEKIDSYAYTLGRLHNETEYWKSEAFKYSKIAGAFSRAHESIKERLKAHLTLLPDRRLTGDKAVFSLKAARPRLILDESKLPSEYFITVTTKEPDKERIRQALTSGETIAGALLEQSYGLHTGVNKGERA